MNKIYISAVVLVLVAGTTVWAAQVQGASYQLFSMRGLVEFFIDHDIIPPHKARTARDLVDITEQVELQRSAGAEVVTVRVSQLIEHADLAYNTLEDVRGLLLLVKNTSDEAIILEGKRRCQSIYRIYRGDTLLYDSSTRPACTTNEHVTYLLEAGATRMFEVRHTHDQYALKPGTYRFELEYPGYGGGDRTITIQ